MSRDYTGTPCRCQPLSAPSPWPSNAESNLSTLNRAVSQTDAVSASSASADSNRASAVALPSVPRHTPVPLTPVSVVTRLFRVRETVLHDMTTSPPPALDGRQRPAYGPRDRHRARQLAGCPAHASWFAYVRARRGHQGASYRPGRPRGRSLWECARVAGNVCHATGANPVLNGSGGFDNPRAVAIYSTVLTLRVASARCATSLKSAKRPRWPR